MRETKILACKIDKPSPRKDKDQIFLWVGSVNLTQIWKEGTLIEKMPPPEWPAGKSIKHFLD